MKKDKEDLKYHCSMNFWFGFTFGLVFFGILFFVIILLAYYLN